MPYKVIIPARYGSSRLPGKPLLDLAGKPMLLHVVEKAQESGAEEILVATDDRRIEAIVKGWGIQVCMTSTEHSSGTERLAEVVAQQDYSNQTLIVNVQGDEPLLPPSLIAQAAKDLELHPEADVATLSVNIANREELFNPNIVKVVRDAQGYALYFSRAPIPWAREDFAAENRIWPTSWPYYRHLGLYTYRAGFLRSYPQLPPCPLEQAERLEQLRVLYHGGRIHVAVADVIPPPGVDTQADLEQARQLLAQKDHPA
ncbi:3-deoxy-D-manno-octulosonate cytidylyltransferase [Nitrosococcus halophilus Nc 4]|uniref:3-deoxy-manno-octulosonate cytidylyltransferase n=1 Tax=Nitrosococcus halophilus (strain Nc4) TaxID=472759 RepID=D5C191_NITHN|nr:3-deoxy-manno-octulosonate cytidylyltransferase [Nitrosococcus halophilus]ADE16443.1 3-deoxy-D-manno-octulosonate cytidylyltransferase [Nitrosococcus halophilus Nc 4]